MENRTNVNRKIVNGRVVDSRVSSVSRQSYNPVMNRRNSGLATGNRTLNTPISRGGFVKGLGLGAAGIAAAGLGLGGVARAISEGYYDEVYTDTPLEVIQNKVDLGGKILFHSTKINGGPGEYYFGNNSIIIGRNGNSVEICGEGDHATKIHGGAPAFGNTNPKGGFFPWLSVGHVNFNITIDNIEFVYPQGERDYNFTFGIYFERCSSATVNNCTFQMNPEPTDYGLPWSAAIFFRILEPISGSINITNNHIFCEGANNAGAISVGNFAGPIYPVFNISSNNITLLPWDLEDEEHQVTRMPGRLATAGFLFHGNTGNINVSDNTIKGSEEEGFTAEVNSCIMFADGTDAPYVHIWDNHFEDAHTQKLWSVFDVLVKPTASAQICLDNHVNASWIYNNHLGTGDVGIRLDVNRAGIKMQNNLLKNNFFSEAYPNQIHYLVHDSIWGLNPGGQFKSDITTYPHFVNNTINDVSSLYLQIENIDETTLGQYNNTWNVQLTPISPVSNDMNKHAAVPVQGPDVMKIWCLKKGGIWDPVSRKCNY